MAPTQQPRSEAPRIIREILLFPFALIGIILILIVSFFADVEWTPAFVGLLFAMTVGAIAVTISITFFPAG